MNMTYRNLSIWILSLFFLNTVILASAKSLKSVAEFDQLFDRAQQLSNEGNEDKALELLKTISIDEIDAADDTTKVFYNKLLGEIYLFRKEYILAENHLEQAVSIYERLRFKYPSYIDMLVFRAYASDALNKREEAVRWYRKALIKGRVVDHNSDMQNNCYLNLGNYYNEKGEYGLAHDFYSKINWGDSLRKVEIHADFYGRTADIYQQFCKSGDWIKAKAVNDSLTNYCLIKYGETHNYYLCCLQNEVAIQFSLNDYRTAILPLKKTIDIGKRHGLQSYYVGYAYNRLIEAFCNLDSVESAIELFPEAIEYMQTLNDERISEAEPCFHIGTACIRIEDFQTGIMALEKFLDYFPQYMRWAIPYAINKLTWAYLNVGRNQEVIDILAPILSQGEQLNDTFISLRPYLHKTLGCSYYVLGLQEDATYNLNEALRLAPEQMKGDSLINEILQEYSTQ